jgi:hypothetical protein
LLSFFLFKPFFDRISISSFFLNLQNQDETFNFISEVKNKVLLIYHYLFQIKYKLYNNYIDLINEIFGLEENKGTGTVNKKNNVDKVNKNLHKQNHKNKVNKNPIEKLKENITSLQGKNDKRALQLDNETKKRLIENYKKLGNARNLR